MHNNHSYSLIVYSGVKNSFEELACKNAINALKAKGKKYKIIDLQKEKFDYIFRGQDLAQYSAATTTKDSVIKYQKITKEASELIFIYESKWNGMDKFIKGFFDQVFLSSGFWKPKNLILFKALWGTTTWIKKWVVITHQPETTYQIVGDPCKAQIMRGTINALTMSRMVFGRPKKKYINLPNSLKAEDKTKEKYLNKVVKIISK